MPKLKLSVLAAFAALVLSGPLQHIGAIPQTAVGDASKAVLKSVKDTLFPPAFAACGIGEGFGSLGQGGVDFFGTPALGSGGGGLGNGGTATGALSGGSGNGGTVSLPLQGPNAGAGQGAGGSGAGAGGGGGFGIGTGGAAGGGLAASSARAGVTQFMVVAPPVGPGPFRESDKLKPRVLLVDANQDSRESDRVLLEQDGYAVMTAANGQEGLKSFEWFLPNVVLVDRELPGNEVVELARNVRKAKVGSSAVLVALAAQAREQERRDSIAAGFDGYLAKPLKIEELDQVIARVGRRTSRTETAMSDEDRPARLVLGTAARPSYAASGPDSSR